MTDPTFDQLSARFNDAVERRDAAAAEAALTAYRAKVDQRAASLRDDDAPAVYDSEKVKGTVLRILHHHRSHEAQVSWLVQRVESGNYRINRPNDKGEVDVVIFASGSENFTVLDVPLELVLRDDLWSE